MRGHDAKVTVLNKKALFVLISALVLLNSFTFLPAYSQISSIDSGCCANQPLAKDFSAFYIGAWRLYHDPAQIYAHAYLSDGEPHIYPQPEQYKYLPSFLFLISPLLLMNYQNAIVIFDIFQFLLLPLIGLLVYSLTDDKGWAITIIAEVLVLLLPAPFPGWGLSVGYFWQWKEAQSKVVETLLLTFAFYLGKKGMPRLSGFSLGLAFFDPRFAIASIPLFFGCNRMKMSLAIRSLAATLILTNLVLLYPGVALSYLEMVFSTGITTALYPYALIPLGEVVFLSFINYSEIKYAFSQMMIIRAPLLRRRS